MGKGSNVKHCTCLVVSNVESYVLSMHTYTGYTGTKDAVLPSIVYVYTCISLFFANTNLIVCVDNRQVRLALKKIDDKSFN